MSNIGKSPTIRRTRYTPQATDPVNPAEGDVFYSNGTPRQEGLWVYRDGAWRKFDQKIAAYTATIKGSISDPTEGTNTKKAYYSIDGNMMTIGFTYNQTTGGVDGSTFYYVTLPSLGLTFDTSLIDVATSFASIRNGTVVGTATVGDVSEPGLMAHIIPVNIGGTLGLAPVVYDNQGFVPNGTSIGGLSENTWYLSFTVTFPVV